MALRIYNTLTGQKEDFVPLTPGKVKMYVCGPTVYDEPHIGHLRSAYVFEVMRNWLKYSGYEVTFVRNVTDVDDKIIQKARQEKTADLKMAVKEVSEKYYDSYKRDLCLLGIREPSREPRATQNVEGMKNLISQLVQKGFAYHVPGSSDVYFEVKKFGQYGKLSKQKTDEMFEEVRKESAPGKRDPLDFALWKSAKDDEPVWESPWGLGRPGWHIECSAMNLSCLGEQIDIHGGGLDLKFPHHENEIAQSESFTGKQFSKYWVHHGLVTVSGQKMSKSLKNFVTLEDVISRKFNPYGLDALKFLFISAQYSSALDFSENTMKDAFNQHERFVNFFRDVNKHEEKAVSTKSNPEWEQRFREAMDDDFNTPKALAVMHELMSDARKKNQPDIFVSAGNTLERWGQVLGDFLKNIRVTAKLQEIAGAADKIDQYKEARKNKDFKTSDAIRRDLLALGIKIRDLPGGGVEW